MDLRIDTARRNIAADIRASTIDGCCFSGMVGLGETYFVALYLAIGFGATAAAWLATLPILAGSFFQLVTPAAISRLGSWKRWTVFNAALQSISLFLMAGLVSWGEASFFCVFLVASLYFGSGQATAPAWNMWVEHLVPRSIRTRFLTVRQRASQICLLIIVVLASVAFRCCQVSGIDPLRPLTAFLFCAGTLRAISTWQLSRQNEAPKWVEQSRREMQVLLDQDRRELPNTKPFLHLLLFLVLMQFSVYISSAFFTPYKIRLLELDYARFSVLVIMSYIGKISSLGLAGRLAARWGACRLLLFGAIGIVPMAAAWAISRNFLYLATVQFCSGVMWACYELAMVMVFVDLIPRSRRLKLLSRYNVANSMAMVAGTALGATLFGSLGQGYPAYLGVFVCSSICRLLVLSAFPWRLWASTGSGALSAAAGRFILFSHSFEMLGRSLFRAWQAPAPPMRIEPGLEARKPLRRESAA
jgi:MFS family permease